ncbi:MAG: tail protein X [Geodermatophilaceae bacterium]|nr:tail protein X [Geodermatophilaceae bacterium]
MTTDSGEYGQASGGGLERSYTTKEGDTLDDLAGFFYGDAAHRQRLLDDNPELAADAPLAPGTRLRVPEDAERGDTANPG